MRLDELTGRRVVRLGSGTDVSAAVGAIEASGPADLVVVDEEVGVASSFGRGADGGAVAGLRRVSLAHAVARGDVFVRSPGFPRYRSELVAAVDRGARVTTPVDLWMGTVGPSRTVIGVTGTKGKSTCCELVGVLAREAGLRVGVAGNLGPAVFGAAWDHEAPIVVLEVSSYQAADLHHVPDVAVVTFLAEDHLSWHGGLERYVADKLRLLRNEGGTAGRILLGEEAGRAPEAVAALGLTGEVVAAPVADPSVPRHRVQNAALAAAALSCVGGGLPADPAATVRAASSSLPGRLDVCPGPEGLLCVDDALASNPSATAAGLAWLRSLGRPTVVLLGGGDRGVDPAPLAREAAAWPGGMLRAVALPDSGVDLAARCGIDLLGVVEDLGSGVATALAAVGPGAAVIFSPGAPTPTGRGNWETRSGEFRRALAAHVGTT